MEGDVSWQGVSGVPGLGCSVENCYKYSSVLKLWEEGSDEREEKITFSDKIVKFFSFRRKNNDQQTVSSSKYSSVSLHKVSVRRSVSAVTTSNRTKVYPRSSDESCQNLIIPNSKSNIRRSVSLHKDKKKQIEREQRQCEHSVESHNLFFRRREIIYFDKQTPIGNLDSLPLSSTSAGKSDYRKLLRSSSTQHQPDKLKVLNTINKERNDTIKKCQATQTDIIDNHKDDEDYDYVYSNSISPAMLIKLSEQLEEKEDEDANIYEEIIPQERKIGRSNSMFFSISQGRRDQLEMYRFAGWDLDLEMNRGGKVNKDNYIRPQTIKEELEKKIIKQSRRKTKENRIVTFADDDKKLQRSRSVNVTSHKVLHSDL